MEAYGEMFVSLHFLWLQLPHQTQLQGNLVTAVVKQKFLSKDWNSLTYLLQSAVDFQALFSIVRLPLSWGTWVHFANRGLQIGGYDVWNHRR